MKKVFLFLVTLVLANSSFSQARLTEVFPDNDGNAQFFEIFNFGSSVADLKLLVKFTVKSGSRVSDSGFYVFTFPNQTTLTPNSYWVASMSASTANSNYNYNTSGTRPSVIRYSQVSNTSRQINENEIMFYKNTNNYIFLLRGNSIIDYMVSGPNNTSAVISEQAKINKWSPFNFGSQTIRFSGIQLFKQNVPNNSAGNGTFYLATASGNCQTSSTNPWVIDATPTPGTKPSGIFDPVSDYWESTFSIPTNSERTVYGQTFEDVQNTLPSPTFALDNLNVLNAPSPTKFYFKLEIKNTTITALQFSSQQKGIISIYSDLDRDGQITTSDLNVTTNATMTFDGLIANVVLNLTPEMFLVSSATKSLHPILFRILNDVNGCFETRNSITSRIDFLLPVALKDFSIKNNNFNILKWTTSTESNNKGFEVQRSMGNTNDFKTIGFVGTRAKDGNSQTEINYSFEDTDVKPGQTHFYRLNQIDFDGKSAFSPVKSIKPGSIESNLSVYPNPSQGSFTVNTGSTSGKLNIFVMDNTGRVVNQYMNVSTTNTKINNLKKGFYTLKIVNTESGELSAQRVVVQ
jgi:hypothetical protein